MNIWEKPRDLSWPSIKPRHGLLQFRNFVVLHNLLDREIIESLILIFFVSHFQLNLFGIMHLGNTGIAIGTGK